MACAKANILHAVIKSNVTNWLCFGKPLHIDPCLNKDFFLYSLFQFTACTSEFFSVTINLSCPRTNYDRDMPANVTFIQCVQAGTYNEWEHTIFLRNRNRRSNQKLREHRWFPVYWRACHRCESFVLFSHRTKSNVLKETQHYIC